MIGLALVVIVIVSSAIALLIMLSMVKAGEKPPKQEPKSPDLASLNAKMLRMIDDDPTEMIKRPE
jgi:hypothetical protein